MKKKNIIFGILLLVLILLGILNLMWLADVNEYKSQVKITGPTKAVGVNNIKIVYMTIHEGRLYPYTIEANKGDKLIISFAAHENAYLVLEEFGINDYIKQNNFEVILDKQGVFPYYCLDCENKDPGYLIIN